jgi:predicted DNA-binding transcriptional regulator AlpA
MAMRRELPVDTGCLNLPFFYMNLGAVICATAFSKSKVYSLIQRGEFPPGDLVCSSRRWKSTDIAAWLTEQAEKAAQREDELADRLKRRALKARASVSKNQEANHAS